MYGTVKIALVIILLVIAAAVVLMFWVLCRSAHEEFAPEQKQEETEDRCENCLRWSECEGVDESCSIRR